MWSNRSIQAQPSRIVAKRAFTITKAYDDAPEAVFASLGLPLVGDLYPGTSFVFCDDVSIQVVSPIMVIATCTYTGEAGNGGGADVTQSPLDNEPTINWRSVTTDEAIDQDFNGKPIVTKNNEPIEGLSERFTDDLVTIERNYAAINRYALRAYRRATNSDTFLGWPPGTARIMEDEATGVVKNGIVQYWKVRVAIQFREPFRTTADKAWYKRVRHEGYLVRDTDGEDPHIAWDLKTKQPVTKKVLLKEDGTREEDPDNAHWLEFQTLGSLPFNALGLV